MVDVIAAAIQMNSGSTISDNLEQTSLLCLDVVNKHKAQLILLPENFAFMGEAPNDVFAIAEPLDNGPIQRHISQLAQQTRTTIVAGSIPIRSPNQAEKVFTASLVYGPQGQQLARYNKIHLFDVALPDGESYRESDRYIAGDTPVSLTCDWGQLGLSICYDLRFPDLYQQLAADIITVPAAFTANTGAVHWLPLLQARAIENQAYVVAANQCGTHANQRATWGHSVIISPWGEVLSQCADEPGFIVSTLSMATLKQTRETFPTLQHRRL